MSDDQSGVSGDLCFVCRDSLNEGEVTLVKERGVRTLLASSISLKNQANIKLLQNVAEISLHSACQKRYNNPKLIKAAVERGDHEVRPSRPTRTTSQFDFRENCLLCGEPITDDFIVKQRKLPPSKRNKVISIECMQTASNVLKAAEKRGDEWGQKIIDRLPPDSDLPALDARYHLFCQRKLYRPIEKGGTRGGCTDPSIGEEMEKVFAFLEGNSEECQFFLSELVEQVGGERKIDPRTFKHHLREHYGDDISIVESSSSKKTVVCFKNTHYKILSDAWYGRKLSDPQEERIRIITAAADIVREDIRSQVYNLAEYPPSHDFLQDTTSDIPARRAVLTLAVAENAG